MKNKIACIGNFTKDQLLWVDHLPAIDDVSTVRKRVECFGGRGAIVACILSSLKCSVSIISTIPRVNIEETSNFLQSHYCSLEGLHIDSAATSFNQVIVTIGRQEKNCTSLYLAGDCTYNLSEKQINIVNMATIVYFTSHDVTASLTILHKLKIADKTIIVNISSYMINNDDYLSQIKEKANVLIGNSLEFNSLCNKLNISHPSELYKYFSCLNKIYLTKGEEGAICITSSLDLKSMSAHRVEVCAPVGIGDAFAAGILYGEVNGLTEEQSMNYGIKLAAISIQSETSCPTHNFLSNQLNNWL